MATDNASGIMDLRISPSSIPQSPWIGRLKAPDKGYFLDPADFGFHGRGPDAASAQSEKSPSSIVDKAISTGQRDDSLQYSKQGKR